MATTITFTASHTSGSATLDVGQLWTALSVSEQAAVSSLCSSLFGHGFGAATDAEKAITLLRYGIAGSATGTSKWTADPLSSRFED